MKKSRTWCHKRLGSGSQGSQLRLIEPFLEEPVVQALGEKDVDRRQQLSSCGADSLASSFFLLLPLIEVDQRVWRRIPSKRQNGLDHEATETLPSLLRDVPVPFGSA